MLANDHSSFKQPLMLDIHIKEQQTFKKVGHKDKFI